MEELLDKGFPEVFFDSFGLQHQAFVKRTQLLYETVGTRGWLVVLTVEILWKAWEDRVGYWLSLEKVTFK